MSETVLVTGATGLLGPPLVRRLRKAGLRVVAAGFSKKADVAFDLRDPGATRRQVAEHKPTVIVHLAASTSVDACETNPKEAFDLNVLPLINLADAVGATGAKLINLSTDQLYDGPGPHAEAAVRPRNIYGTTKYYAELVAARVRATNLRVNFFGKSETPGRVSASDDVLRKLRAGDEYAGFEDIFFDPLSMPTLSRMIERVVAQPVSGTFNVGSHGGLSRYEFAYQIAETFKLPLDRLRKTTSASLALKAYRPKDMRMDVTLFEKTFNVKLPTLSEEIVLAEELL